jgi:hypothetical protein
MLNLVVSKEIDSLLKVNNATSFPCKPQRRRQTERINTPILNFCNSKWWSVLLSSRFTPLPIKMLGSTACLDIMDRRRISLTCWESNPRLSTRPARSLVTIPTELFQLSCRRHRLRNGQWFPDNVWGGERKLDVVSRRNESLEGLGCAFYGIFSQLGRALR